MHADATQTCPGRDVRVHEGYHLHCRGGAGADSALRLVLPAVDPGRAVPDLPSMVTNSCPPRTTHHTAHGICTRTRYPPAHPPTHAHTRTRARTHTHTRAFHST